MRKTMLIVDDIENNRAILSGIFTDEFDIKTAEDGRTALLKLGFSGMSISVVLLSLALPGMDGFQVLQSMGENIELRSIPVIALCGRDEKREGLRAISCGAADYVCKPLDPDLIRLRVESVVSRAENARRRAENDYALLQSSKEIKYRTVLESSGTVVVEFDRRTNSFSYDPSIAKHIAGTFDQRRLWQILMADMVADVADVKTMQELLFAVGNDEQMSSASLPVRLKTPAGTREWFLMQVFKPQTNGRHSSKLLITFNNVNEETETRERLRYQAERDELTGLYNRSTFFQKAEQMLAAHPPGHYVMSGFDIDKFKVVNDLYGSDKGDEVLRQISAIFTREFDENGGLSGRISGDNFVNLYPVSLLDSNKLEQIISAVSELDGSIPPISYSIGRYLVDDLTLSASAMYDRAVLAKASVKGRYDINIGWYEEPMRDRLIQEQEIITEMKPALQSGQFEVWLQPQYNHATQALIGAEALVRWRHPQKGIVPPAEFIPVFERNGFVYELDKYVWRQTCILLRQWMNDGHQPLPVSVNISRYDLFREDLLEYITGLLKDYQIPINMLRLEITETAFSVSNEQVVAVVRSLIEHGFTVEIDDFGSGYSSLNTLKDVPAQILKLDMRFLDNSGDSDRGGNVLESVVRMAKWLGMAVIAEGVEKIEQADFLKSIGCFYVQGYLYSRPLPAGEYEALSRSANKESRLQRLHTVKNLDNNAFWDPQSMDTLIFNSYVGSATIIEYRNGSIELLRATDKFLQMLDAEGVSAEETLKLDWSQHFAEGSESAFNEAVQRSIETNDETVFDCVFSELPGSSKKLYLRITLRVIASVDDHCLLYCSNENITAQRETEQKTVQLYAKIANDRQMLQTMMDDTPGGFVRLRVDDNGSVSTEYVNDNFCRLCGTTRERLLAGGGSGPLSMVHPDDLQLVRQTVREMTATAELRHIKYRLRHADGTYFPVTAYGRVTLGEPGEKFVNVYYTDLSEQEKKEMTIRETVPFVLSAILASSTDLAFAKDNELRYICCSAEFVKMAGRREADDIVGKTDHDIFAPELAAQFGREDTELLQTQRPMLDYVQPIPVADGSIRYYKLSKHVLIDAFGNTLGIYGVGRDITEERGAYAQLKLLVDTIPGGIASYISSPEGMRITYFNDGYCNMFGYTYEEYRQICADGITNITFAEDIPLLMEQVRLLLEEDKPLDHSFRVHTKDGGYKWVNLRGGAAERHGDICMLNAVMSDITELREREQRNLELAKTDPLTGVLNRAAFAQALERLVTDPTRTADLALLMLDIDAFKRINDTFGHARGDQVLQETAVALRGVLRREDLLGRLGGDEFLILLRDVFDDETIRRKAVQICKLLRKSLNTEVNTSTSIGIAVCPRDGNDFETLYRKADIALYRVKGSGKDNFAFYSDGYQQAEA